MASRKSFLAKPSYVFPASPETHFNQKSSPQEGHVFEFDEAELWNSCSSSPATTTEAKKVGLSGSRSGLKRASRKVVDGSGGGGGGGGGGGRVSLVGPASLPVNIPDWSKILKEDYKEHRKWESDGEDAGDENEEDQLGGIRVPPHEYLARTRGASLSVHEGIGRTLKGRDLRSVRNAIWKKVGFED